MLREKGNGEIFEESMIKIWILYIYNFHLVLIYEFDFENLTYFNQVILFITLSLA